MAQARLGYIRHSHDHRWYKTNPTVGVDDEIDESPRVDDLKPWIVAEYRRLGWSNYSSGRGPADVYCTVAHVGVIHDSGTNFSELGPSIAQTL